MASLPTIGGSIGTWASQLKAWLEVSHNDDGTLLTSAVQSSLGGYMPSGITSQLGPQFYEAARNIYGLKPDRYRASRAKLGQAIAGAGRFKVALVGDSITAGFQATRSTQATAIVLAALLKARGVPLGGDGMVLFGTASTSPDDRWDVANWTQHLVTGADGQAAGVYYTPTDTTTPIVLTPTNPFTAFAIYHGSSTGGSYSVDGGSYTTFTGTGATVQKLTVTGLSAGTHTISIKGAGTSLTVFGVACYSTAGVEVSNFGKSGATSATWLDTTSFFYADLINVLIAYAPDLVIYNIGTNDYGQGPRTPAALLANIEAFAALLPSSDLMLVVPPPVSDTTKSAYYHQTYYDAADALGVALLDLNDRWGSYAAANTDGLEYGDGTHPNASGYAEIAVAHMGLLVP